MTTQKPRSLLAIPPPPPEPRPAPPRAKTKPHVGVVVTEFVDGRFLITRDRENGSHFEVFFTRPEIEQLVQQATEALK